MAMMAAAMFASCSNEETIVVAQPDEIGFGAPFIENSTRAIDPSYGATGMALTEFSVWGTVKGKGDLYTPINIFDGDDIVGSVGAGAWSCEDTSQTQYWVPNCDYNFVALTKKDAITFGENSFNNYGMPQGFTYEAEKNADVMVAKATASTNEIAVPTTNNNGYVNMIFQHTLSKIKFTFTTGSAGVFKIKDIKIGGFYASGICDITSTPVSWKGQDGTISALSYGHASNAKTANSDAEGITATNPVTSNYEHLFIPGTYAAGTLEVTFTKEYYLSASDTQAASTEPVRATLPELIAQPNNAYNIAVNLEGGSQITFKIGTMENWGTSTDVDTDIQ